MRPVEVIADLVALDRHLDPDRDQPLAEGRVVVDVVLGLPGSVGHLGDPLARQALDVVLYLGEPRGDRLLAVLVDEPEDLLLGDARGLGLRVILMTF